MPLNMVSISGTMKGTTGINSGQVSRWADVVGIRTSLSSMSKLMRSITFSRDACMGFMDNLDPRDCPTNSDVMQLERGTVSLVVVA
jgi:hypothetical protein